MIIKLNNVNHFQVLLFKVSFYFYLLAEIVNVFKIMNIIPFLGNGLINLIIGNLLLGYVILSGSSFKSSLMVSLYFVIFVFMLLNGFVGGFVDRTYAFHNEFMYYLRFGLMLMIGYDLFLFEQFKKIMYNFVFIGIFLNIFAIIFSDYKTRIESNGGSLAYQLQFLLLPAFFLIFNYRSLNRKKLYIIIIAIGLFFMEQILFEKRLTLIYAVLLLFSLIYYMKFRNRQLFQFFNDLLRLRFLLVSSTLLIIVLALSGKNLFVSYDRIIGRFNENENGKTVFEDERWEIGKIITDDVYRTNDQYFGRGTGAYVENNKFPGNEQLNLSGRRTTAEMGIPTILLKGGYVLLIYFLLIFAVILYRFRFAKRYYAIFPAWIFAFLWFVFIPMAGFISTSISDVLIAYSIGICLAPKNDILRNIQLNKFHVFRKSNIKA